MARKSVFIIDDDDDLRDMYRRGLKSLNGVEVRAFGDGVAALLEIGRAKPDAVILDIRMPGLNGFDICRALRSGKATSDIRILAVSGEILKPAEEEMLAANADGWLRKPAPIKLLRERVAELLGIVVERK